MSCGGREGPRAGWTCRGRGPGHQLRILVCGSRVWRDPAPIALGISDWLESIGTCIGHAYPIPIIVHGSQRTWDPRLREWYGADWVAGCIARNWGFGEERHPADWDTCAPACNPAHRQRRPGGGGTYCPNAGPRRNAEMVATRPDVCLGFPAPGGKSRGTRGCIALAQAAGIPVVVHEPGEPARLPPVR